MKKLRIVLAALFGLLFLFSLYKLSSIFFNYRSDEKIYEDVRSVYKSAVKETVPPETERSLPLPEIVSALDRTFEDHEYEAESLKFLHTSLDYILLPRYELNFDILLSENPDVIGWIVMEGTEIDYPVVQGETNETYIRTGIDGQPHNAGCIFADFRNETPFRECNTILYGHNQKNHKMFHDLIRFTDPEFALSHPYFTVYLADGGIQTYEIIAAYDTTAVDRTYQILFYPDYPQSAHIGYVLSQSAVDFGVTVSEAETLLTLSTCTNEDEDGRCVVVARLFTESE